jgi:hypothetical protein
MYPISIAMMAYVSTSAVEPFTINKKLIACLLVPSSSPSAILLGIETAALRI